MIKDSHQHFWKYDPLRNAWIDVSIQVVKRDFQQALPNTPSDTKWVLMDKIYDLISFRK